MHLPRGPACEQVSDTRSELSQVTQPRVSDLLRGRIDLFSTDSLIDMLARLNVRVRFVLKPARGRVA